MIHLRELKQEYYQATIKMITEFFNYHRELTNAPREFWTNDEESEETLKEWLEKGSVFSIFYGEKLAGFVSIRFGGTNAAWLEDIFIDKEFRNKGIGKLVIKELDDILMKKGILAMFVDVIPRNTTAMQFYIDCGFDHLNMVQLRKNYDERLNKDENIDILGFSLKKY